MGKADRVCYNWYSFKGWQGGFAMENQDLLNMVTTIGYLMLEHGAEIYRVEESIRRMAVSYGARAIDVFAIPSSIVVTLTPQNGNPITQTKRIQSRNTDLDKIDQLNNLCRHICQERPDIVAIRQSLANIQERPIYSWRTNTICTALVASAFTLFFGGSVRDAIVACVIGLALKWVVDKMEWLQATAFFINIVGGFATATLALLAVRLGVADNMDKMIIGTLMNLVPGLALTNSMRDFIAGDVIAGMMKMTEALLVATGIAIGVAIPLSFLRIILGI